MTLKKPDHILQLKSNGSMHFHINDNFVCYSDIDLTHDKKKKLDCYICIVYWYATIQITMILEFQIVSNYFNSPTIYYNDSKYHHLYLYKWIKFHHKLSLSKIPFKTKSRFQIPATFKKLNGKVISLHSLLTRR